MLIPSWCDLSNLMYVMPASPQVGHLTRNVKMRGNVNEDHLEMVDACPQTFDPDQFATQTCFQGRYGA